MAATENAIWFQDSKSQLDAVLGEVCEELQLSKARHDLAVERYSSVNTLLEKERSPFRLLSPRIFPQGSMALGTTSKPVEGPHDLDFVLQVDAPYWRLHPLAALHALYEFLGGNETYRKMVTLKNRVVRLTYADEFYMDILPAYTDVQAGGTRILVPDRSLACLRSSDPQGYIRWFKNRCLLRRRWLLDKAVPVPPREETEQKEPLQLSVQLLKRWRDLAFDENVAPISIILTTLAGICYQGEQSLSGTLATILNGIADAVAAADSNGRRIEVRNPSNIEEDFGERWDANPRAYFAFREKIQKLQGDWLAILAGGRNTNWELERLFGEHVRTVLLKRAQRLQEARKAGVLGVTSAGAITGLSQGITRIPQNVFHGDE